MRNIVCLLAILTISACTSQPVDGPDKQFVGTFKGAALGAGAGAVTGAQLTAGTGPGMAVGAGFGALAGGIQGLIVDQTEMQMQKLAAETRREKQRTIAQEILNENNRRRLELHPAREIYPADLFFYGDQVRLRGCSKAVVEEVARMSKERLPYSRLAVVAYTKAKDKDSTYAKYLSSRRSRALVDQLVRSGLEPRRLEARAVVVDAPLLIDPLDSPFRYNQAIEIVAVDR